jgi:hypothetical protein
VVYQLGLELLYGTYPNAVVILVHVIQVRYPQLFASWQLSVGISVHFAYGFKSLATNVHVQDVYQLGLELLYGVYHNAVVTSEQLIDLIYQHPFHI